MFPNPTAGTKKRQRKEANLQPDLSEDTAAVEGAIAAEAAAMVGGAAVG